MNLLFLSVLSVSTQYPALGGCSRIRAYCGKAEISHFSHSISLNIPNIRLNRWQKLANFYFPSRRRLFSDSLLGKIILLITFCLNLQSQSQAQTIYTWVDERGIAHFSHHPSTLPKVSSRPATTLPYINKAIAPPKSSIKKTTSGHNFKKTKPKKKPTTGKIRTQQLAKNCQGYRAKLEKIQIAMRRGYKEPQGNRYREQRRKYSDLLFQRCR
ncbi:MAG: DUF4124 domain-containing protein [Pseudomonadales bacterium]